MPEKLDYIVTYKGVFPCSEVNTMHFSSDHSVYEVIRVIDGIALFLEDHYARLIISAQIGGLQFEMELSEFRQNIAELGRINQIQNGNVKFVVSDLGNEIQWLFSFIPHSYPDINDFGQGVSTGLLFAERENPNAKIIQNTIRDMAKQMIADRKLFEVLLVDRNGLITEGSRSNVFFVKGNRFFTAPASQVLEGVTRRKVLECISELNFPIVEEAVLSSEISTFDAAFLTGTSPNVLPVNSVGTVPFATDNLWVEQLMAKYNSVIKLYLDERQK